MKPLVPLTITGLSCLFAISACQKSEASVGLPPATGSEASALPVINATTNETQSVTGSSDSVLRATGSTYAIEEAELGPKGSGVLASVIVDEGDKVRKGQLLFALDAAQASLTVQQAKASVQAAEVGRSRAQLDFDRTKPLYERGAVPPATFDQVRLGLDQASVVVTQANVALATAKQALADSAVTSPLRGVVTKRFKNAGETVTMMPPTTVVVIQDLSRIEIRVHLPEGATGRIKAGDSMQVNFRALGETLNVPITRINPSIDARSRTFEVVAIVDNADAKYKAGMLVECTFPQATTAGAPGAAPPPSAAGAPKLTTPTPSGSSEVSAATAPKAPETAKAP